MSKHPAPSSRFPIFRRLWRPALATSTGGTAVAIWMDELVRYGEEILVLISLPVMAGGIYLLDILIFKSQMPRSEDTKNSIKKGVEQ